MKALLAILLAAAAGVAHAHAYLQRSEPPSNAAISQPPKEVRLRFSEPVEQAFVEVTVMRDGRPMTAAKPQVSADGHTVSVAVEGGAPGAWAVRWTVVAKDGHRSQGKVEFAVNSR